MRPGDNDFRAAIEEGIADVEAGLFEVVADLGAWFDVIEAEVEASC